MVRTEVKKTMFIARQFLVNRTDANPVSESAVSLVLTDFIKCRDKVFSLY